MKRTFLLLTFLVVMASLLVMPAFSQFTNNAKESNTDGNGKIIRFSATVNGTADQTSKAFSLSEYDGHSFYDFPIAFAYKRASTAGTAIGLIFAEGSFGDGTWVLVDTLATLDSLETHVTGTADFNNKKFPFYRVVFDGRTGNAADSVFELALYVYRRDDHPLK